jgi:hypothetical protein
MRLILFGIFDQYKHEGHHKAKKNEDLNGREVSIKEKEEKGDKACDRNGDDIDGLLGGPGHAMLLGRLLK